MTTERLDVALVSRGLTRSRTAAATAIAEGRVLVDGTRVFRAADRVDDLARLAVEPGDPWVGRAGRKLDTALDAFGIEVAGRLGLDLGASTGGFTEVLLARGARRVVALDVGHGQLVASLRADPRVVVVEGENARDLDRPRLAALTGSPEAPAVVVADLSFISLRLVLGAVAEVIAVDGDVVLLVKPQFEVGRARARNGVVTDERDRAEAVRSVLATAEAVGLHPVALAASPVPGTHGNREVLVHLHRSCGLDPAEWTRLISEVAGGQGRETR